MASTCISSCTDNVDRRALVPRASYLSLHKWPESDAEFVRSINFDAGRGSARAVDIVSCRQMYLRSYTFSRKRTLPERTKKCFDKVRVSVINRGDRSVSSARRVLWNSRVALIKMKAVDLSCSALWDVLRRLLACTTKVDAVDHGDR